MRMTISAFLRRRGARSYAPYSSVLLLCRALACAAVAWMAAQMLWWVGTPSSPPLPAKALPALVEQTRRVVGQHFFGVADSREPPTDGPGGSSSQDAQGQRWKLLGTYVDPVGRSRALLVLDGTADVLIAQVGDRLPSGHVLAEVRPESVVVGKDAQRAELTLRATAGGPGATPDAQPLPPGARVPPPPGAAPFTKDSR